MPTPSPIDHLRAALDSLRAAAARGDAEGASALVAEVTGAAESVLASAPPSGVQRSLLAARLGQLRVACSRARAAVRIADPAGAVRRLELEGSPMWRLSRSLWESPPRLAGREDEVRADRDRRIAGLAEARLRAGEPGSAAPAEVEASVVVCVDPDPEIARRSLESLLLHTWGLGDRVELILVDDAGAPGFRTVLRSIPGAQVVELDRSLGPNAAAAAGLAVARGARVAVVAGDLLVPPGWLEELSACLDVDPSIARAAPNCVGARAVGAGGAAAPLAGPGSSRRVDLARLPAGASIWARWALEAGGWGDPALSDPGMAEEDRGAALEQAGLRQVMAIDLVLRHQRDPGPVRVPSQDRELLRETWGGAPAVASRVETDLLRYLSLRRPPTALSTILAVEPGGPAAALHLRATLEAEVGPPRRLDVVATPEDAPDVAGWDQILFCRDLADLEDPQRALREAVRRVVPGGSILLCCRHQQGVPTLLRQLGPDLGLAPDDPSPVVRAVAADVVGEWLSAAGCDVELTPAGMEDGSTHQALAAFLMKLAPQAPRDLGWWLAPTLLMEARRAG